MRDVRFLPAARQDMVDIARYIAVELKAPDAARVLYCGRDTHSILR